MCKEYGAVLASVPSLATYDAFKRFVADQGSSSNKYWIGAKKLKNSRSLLWTHLQLDTADWVNYFSLQTVRKRFYFTLERIEKRNVNFRVHVKAFAKLITELHYNCISQVLKKV